MNRTHERWSEVEERERQRVTARKLRSIDPTGGCWTLQARCAEHSHRGPGAGAIWCEPTATSAPTAQVRGICSGARKEDGDK